MGKKLIIRKGILYVLCTIIMLMITSVEVFASPGFEVEATAILSIADGNAPVVNSICGEANAVAGKDIAICYTGNNVLYFYGGKYASLDPEDKEAYMVKILSLINSSGLGVKTKNQLYRFFEQQDSTTVQAIKYLVEDTQADFVKARSWLRPFTSVFSTFTGILALVIFLFSGLGILMDVAYLALPGLQLILERGDERKKPFGVSAEAWRVNKEIALDHTNSKNEVTEYMKKRIPIIFVCAICLGYLISGQIYEILVYISNAFSNI